jgi:hypothetical protein
MIVRIDPDTMAPTPKANPMNPAISYIRANGDRPLKAHVLIPKASNMSNTKTNVKPKAIPIAASQAIALEGPALRDANGFLERISPAFAFGTPPPPNAMVAG